MPDHLNSTEIKQKGFSKDENICCYCGVKLKQNNTSPISWYEGCCHECHNEMNS